MEYAFLLWPHANTRYVASLKKLAFLELQCMLQACRIPAQIAWKDLGGAPWLIVSCSSLPPFALSLIAGHSSIYMGALLENGLLHPLNFKQEEYVPADMAEVLKYKGKTNAAFTSMMLNCALCASSFVQAAEPLTVLDPMCGKGTTLFCALERGCHSIGIETDGKSLQEAGSYITRYLQLHRLKHKVNQGSLTLPGGKNAPFTLWQMADTPAHYAAGDLRTLKLIHGDTVHCASMLKEKSVHLIAADLPYGVQHAARQGKNISPFASLLKAALPGWLKVLKPGGAIALSFNAYTLKRSDLQTLLQDAGFSVFSEPPYSDFEHWVEQAVQRDFVVAVKA